MADFQLTMPKMGEGIIEATILSWHKKPGESIQENEIILEVATDKVDSEIPSPVTGVVKEILFKEDDIVTIDQVIAIIETEGVSEVSDTISIDVEENQSVKDLDKITEYEDSSELENDEAEKRIAEEQTPLEDIPYLPKETPETKEETPNSSSRFYSPLVKNIAKAEDVSFKELENIEGTGIENRVTKNDILKYIEDRKSMSKKIDNENIRESISQAPEKTASITSNNQDEIIEMDRMRKLIAKNMVDSKRISAHVSSFVEVDMTNVVQWREQHKLSFKKQKGYSLTYMPIITEAIVKAIKDFPMINISVDGDRIIKKKNINIGIATALPSGNLIVPVLKNADNMSLTGLASKIWTLTEKARSNQLTPSDIQGGTYTISNIGTFGNILGTPIIPQPQVAIMAIGAITKKPVVLETKNGDVIAIRHMMYLSHTYDHRVVDGALGGMFVKRVAEYLENFNRDQEI